MPLPQSAEYNEAIQNLRTAASDEELRQGSPALNALGTPLLWSGGFADVYKVHCPKTHKTWAVKCFTRESPGLRERYREISAHLHKIRLPFMVDFQFVEPGLRIGRRQYPFLKMRWVEGLSLNAFLADYLEKPKILAKLQLLWVKLASRLREAKIAHADLQHGNVLLVPASDGALSLRLIDYDGMHVPALAGGKSGELGHPCYQHPQRLREGIYSAEVDRFSHLAIYTAIRCLIADGPALWKHFDNGDNLLFREPDFRDPANSQLFHALWGLPDPAAHIVVGRLLLATQQPLVQVPLLDEILVDGKLKGLTRQEERQASAVLDGAAAATKPFSIPLPTSKRPAPAPSQAEIGTLPERKAETAVDAVLVTADSLAAPSVAPLDAEIVSSSLAMHYVHRGLTALRKTALLIGAFLRPVDRYLLRLVGDDNTILHWAARITSTVAAVSLLAVGLSAANKAISHRKTRYEAALAEHALAAKAADAAATQAEAEKAHPEMATQDAAPKEGAPTPMLLNQEITVDLGNGVTMQMVLIPTGEFLMGLPDSVTTAWGDEKPQHRVRISKPFYLAKYEVTQQQWQTVMGNNPSVFTAPRNPIENVSWNDAKAFCDRVAQKDGKEYRLPTEAEWEYACRGGAQTQWSFGDNESNLEEYAWFAGNSSHQTHGVGQKMPNAWGLHDMHGNVWEWCRDCYDDSYYQNSAAEDPEGPTSGSRRVTRGGSWDNQANGCRAASRGNSAIEYRYRNLGFRVAMTIGDLPSNPMQLTTVNPPTVAAQSIENEVTADLGSGVKMKMVLIPAGEFLMGSPEDERYRRSDEGPVHRVQISKPFYLGKYEVTVGQYRRFVDDSTYGTLTYQWRNAYPDQTDDHPVVRVSWDDAKAFCDWLAKKEAKEYRLPTEAQWEYACRAGTQTPWSFGEDETVLGEYAWFIGNSGGQTHAVGQKKPNAWGLYDMHGNVYEWCADWFDDEYYRVPPLADPPGPVSGTFRVLRGGASFIGGGCRSSERHKSPPGLITHNDGFRVARTITAQSENRLITSPRFKSIGPQSVDTGKNLMINAAVENAEQWKGKLRYLLSEPSPLGATIDEKTGQFAWTPSVAGVYLATVGVESSDGQKDQKQFAITVNAPSPEKEITVDLGSGLKMRMVLIPAGEFMMGSEHSYDSSPVHRVRITRPFHLGTCEVTQQQYQQVTGSNPSFFRDATHPVENVTWTDAMNFCQKLSVKTGKEYRLPTEAEWEYACRAGTITSFSFGDSISALREYAWYQSNSGRSTQPVGQKHPNAFGLYDMHGNVWEWCADWYERDYYSKSPRDDPNGPASDVSRVCRGGAWSMVPDENRSATRFHNLPYTRVTSCGFRVARTIAGYVEDRLDPSTRMKSLGAQTADGGETVKAKKKPRPVLRPPKRPSPLRGRT